MHGHGMTAKDMDEWMQHLQLYEENMHYVFLQAPFSWYAPASQFLPSWFAYTKEYEGLAEDEICEAEADAMLDRVDSTVQAVLLHLRCESCNTVCVGFSEGGCIALELATRCPFKAVVTLVSHRRTTRACKPLLCPWYALTAVNDNVYHPSWALEHARSAHVWETVDDEHYLHASDREVRDFLRASFGDA